MSAMHVASVRYDLSLKRPGEGVLYDPATVENTVSKALARYTKVHCMIFFNATMGEMGWGMSVLYNRLQLANHRLFQMFKIDMLYKIKLSFGDKWLSWQRACFVRQLSSFDPDISQKNGRHMQRSGQHTLAPPKIYQKNVFYHFQHSKLRGTLS